MALRVKAENVPVKKVVLSADQGQGSMIVRQAYGNESSLMMATRPPGYHTSWVKSFQPFNRFLRSNRLRISAELPASVMPDV